MFADWDSFQCLMIELNLKFFIFHQVGFYFVIEAVYRRDSVCNQGGSLLPLHLFNYPVFVSDSIFNMKSITLQNYMQISRY